MIVYIKGLLFWLRRRASDSGHHPCLAAGGSRVALRCGRRPLTIAATTSIADSGLVEALLPRFKAGTGISTRLLSRSSALALISAERGNVDVVIVNDPAAVDRLAESGHGVKRRRVMLDDFVIAGPAGDPAAVRGGSDAAAAMRSIARQRQPFLSRGDESGTNVAEHKL